MAASARRCAQASFPPAMRCATNATGWASGATWRREWSCWATPVSSGPSRSTRRVRRGAGRHPQRLAGRPLAARGRALPRASQDGLIRQGAGETGRPLPPAVRFDGVRRACPATRPGGEQELASIVAVIQRGRHRFRRRARAPARAGVAIARDDIRRPVTPASARRTGGRRTAGNRMSHVLRSVDRRARAGTLWAARERSASTRLGRSTADS
jgi:hypothetical protein